MMATTNFRTTMAGAAAVLGLVAFTACGADSKAADDEAGEKQAVDQKNPDGDPDANKVVLQPMNPELRLPGGLTDGPGVPDGTVPDPDQDAMPTQEPGPDGGEVDAVAAQDPETQDPKKGAASALQEMFARFKKQGIHLDLKNKTVALDCVMNNPVDTIEFALIHRRGKTHEGLLYTFAQPSLLNASLLMLGLQNGVNVTYREADPLPTREEVDLGAEPVEVFPPRGQQVWLTVRWTDVDDKEIEIPLEDLLLDLDTQTEIDAAKFVFLGGTVRPMERGGEPKFFADLEGNLVSTVYRSPPNHLITIVHDKARSDGQWWTTALCPDEGTRVQLVFHVRETELHRARIARIQAEGLRDAGGRTGPQNQVPNRAGSGTHQPVAPKGEPGKNG